MTLLFPPAPSSFPLLSTANETPVSDHDIDPYLGPLFAWEPVPDYLIFWPHEPCCHIMGGPYGTHQ